MTAGDLLAELDLPVAVGRRKDILEAFADAVDPLYQLVADADRKRDADGNLVFAILHLAGRSVSDLLAAGHLAVGTEKVGSLVEASDRGLVAER